MGGAANGTVPARPAGESAIAPVASRYRRREPERTLLHATVRAHWKTFLAEVEVNPLRAWPDGVLALDARAVRATALDSGSQASLTGHLS